MSAGRASVDDRRYLNDVFERLCRIESPSGQESGCAEAVIQELRSLGLEPEEDSSQQQTGADCGNLLARLDGGPGSSEQSILLCAHLDTVPLAAPVEPTLLDGYWQNAAEGILGADNKAAIAVILTLARKCAAQAPAVNLELLFTVCEERSLLGARAFDVSRLCSAYGYVFDHASPIGEIVVSSPCHYRLEATFRGAAAHAGIRPESGSSAILAAAHAIASMPHGRIDEQTTTNIGTIRGGSAINVVAESCELQAEVRSLSEERAEQTLARLVDLINEAANRPECDCDVDVTVERTFAAYRLASSSPAVSLAASALQACGYEPELISSGGASDANALIARGLPVVNLANGTEHNHEPGERVSVSALEGMLDVAMTLLQTASAHASNDAR
ncbi:MAG TPA: M20/M25/M40 family metallo-hydrolase [Solirubrobacteraceae bacterium]|jgi:tripeptide aminopeptidase